MAALDEVDAAIFRTPIPDRRSEGEWQAIVGRLAETLGRFVAAELEVVDSDVVDGVALSCLVESRRPVGGPLEFRMRGIVGFEAIEGRPYVNALLFLYSRGLRLAVEGQGASFVECLYERADGDGGRWRVKGWGDDVYAEYAHVAPNVLP